MESQVRNPHPQDCILAKVEEILGPSKVRALNTIGMCPITCRSCQPFTVMLAVLLNLAPRSHGWARWNSALMKASNYESLADWGDDKAAKKELWKLIRIAPRPRSYIRWNSFLKLVGEEIGGRGTCVRCGTEHPLSEMIHRGSDQYMSEFAGLVCKPCNALIEGE